MQKLSSQVRSPLVDAKGYVTDVWQRWFAQITGGVANGAAAAWGSITGLLSEQTDLRDALNLKANVSDLSGLVPNTRTVNGHALSADVTVTKGDVGLGNVENVVQEPALGNPASDNYVLASTAAGARSWVAQGVVAGGAFTRTDISFTTASVAAGVAATGSISIAKSFFVLAASADYPADVVLFPTSTDATVGTSKAGWTATATFTSGTNVATNAIDADPSTYWWSGAALPQSLTIDMQVSKVVSKITVSRSTTYTSDQPRAMTVYGSNNNNNWDVLGSVTVSSDTPLIVIPADLSTPYRYIKVTLTTSSGGWVQVGNVEIESTGRIIFSKTVVGSGTKSYVGIPGVSANGDTPASSTIYYLVRNRDSVSRAVTVTLTLIKLNEV